MSRPRADRPDRAADAHGVDFGAGGVSPGGGRRGEPRLVPDADVRTYYDRPVLKAPVWKARYIATYFFTGGLVSCIRNCTRKLLWCCDVASWASCRGDRVVGC